VHNFIVLMTCAQTFHWYCTLHKQWTGLLLDTLCIWASEVNLLGKYVVHLFISLLRMLLYVLSDKTCVY